MVTWMRDCPVEGCWEVLFRDGDTTWHGMHGNTNEDEGVALGRLMDHMVLIRVHSEAWHAGSQI